jgi:hypothetical protein
MDRQIEQALHKLQMQSHSGSVCFSVARAVGGVRHEDCWAGIGKGCICRRSGSCPNRRNAFFEAIAGHETCRHSTFIPNELITPDHLLISLAIKSLHSAGVIDVGMLPKLASRDFRV